MSAPASSDADAARAAADADANADAAAARGAARGGAFMLAALGVPGHARRRSPVWAMRQAGRYLPEFRALRARHDFFSMCHTPALCAAATTQPLARFPTLDALVVFSDILIVPQAMGLEVLMAPGPVFPRPLRAPADVARLALAPDADAAFAPLYAGIRATRARAVAMGRPDVPVIGFCGGPWTLMSYMVGAAEATAAATAAAATSAAAAARAGGSAATATGGGGGRSDGAAAAAGAPAAAPAVAPAATPAAAPSSAPSARAGGAGGERGHDHARAWLLAHPAESHALLAAISKVCVELLVGCFRAGASVLQVFESSAGELPATLFAEFALPYLQSIAAAVRARTGAAADGGPVLLVFPREQHSAAGLEAFVDSAFDGVSLDWKWDAAEAAGRVERATAAAAAAGRPRRPLVIQGNVDPAVLFCDAATIARHTARAVVAVRAAAPSSPHVVNLGHGMLPAHEPRALAAFLAAAHAASGALAAGRGAAAAEEEAVAAAAAPPHVEPAEPGGLAEPAAAAE